MSCFCLEEREYELEALQSLFTETEFKLLKGGVNAEFLITVTPSFEDPQLCSVTFKFAYTKEYPSEPPEWLIVESKGVDPRLYDSLRKVVEEEFELGVGGAMIFVVCQAVQQWLTKNKPDDTFEDAKECEEAEEQQYGLIEKYLPTEEFRVTQSEFYAWLEVFRKEQIESGIWQDANQNASQRLTGRQLFERNKALAKSDLDDRRSPKSDTKSPQLHWENEKVFDDNTMDFIDMEDIL